MSTQTTKAEEAWNSIEEAAEKDDAEVDEVLANVLPENYHTMLNVSRSAGETEDGERVVDLSDSPGKQELRERMVEAEIYPGGPGDDDFYRRVAEGEFEEIELKESQYDPDGSSSEPKDKTVLYCLTRAETTEDRVEEIRGALEDVGYELREAGNGDKFSIVLPAEEPEEPEEAQDGEESDESDEEAEEEAEAGDEEETDESESEADDEAEDEEEEDDGEEEEDDDEGAVPYEVYEGRLEDKPKTSDDEEAVYDIATDLDVDGRSSMTKEELIDAILEVRIEQGKVAEP